VKFGFFFWMVSPPWLTMLGSWPVACDTRFWTRPRDVQRVADIEVTVIDELPSLALIDDM